MIKFTRQSYTYLSNNAWLIRRNLAEQHDCKVGAISWKGCLLLALATDLEAQAKQARMKPLRFCPSDPSSATLPHSPWRYSTRCARLAPVSLFTESLV